MNSFLSSTPVKDLEDWFLAKLRLAFPKEVYTLIGHEADQEFEPVPYDFVRVIYTGMTNRKLTGFVENRYSFQVVYSSHLPNSLLPHRRALAMLELGRETLFEQRPVGLLNAFPLQLESERLGKAKKGCDCGPVYVQNWNAYNKVQSEIIPSADPCFGEKDSLIPLPTDYISPINNQYYQGINPKFNVNLPISNGNLTNQFPTWTLIPNATPPFNNPRFYWDNGEWVIYPNFDPNLPETYGNLPFIPFKFIKSISGTILDYKTGFILANI
jgi:hypothetical protein